MFHHRSILRLLVTVTTVVLALGGLSSWVLAVQVQHTPVRIDGSVADFGSGNHSFGSPQGNGSVTFDYTVVNQQIVATARVRGTLYWDALASGCARLIIEFRDLSGNVIATQRVDNTQCPAPGFNANSSANQAPVDRSFANANLHSVRLRTANVTTGTENITGTSTVTAPRTGLALAACGLPQLPPQGVMTLLPHPHLAPLPEVVKGDPPRWKVLGQQSLRTTPA